MDLTDQDYREAAAIKYKDHPRVAKFEYDAKVLRGFRYAPETFEKTYGAKLFDSKDRSWFVEDSEVPALLKNA